MKRGSTITHLKGMSLNSFLISLTTPSLHALMQASPALHHKDLHALLTVKEKNNLFQALLRLNLQPQRAVPHHVTAAAPSALDCHTKDHLAITERLQHTPPRLSNEARAPVSPAMRQVTPHPRHENTQARRLREKKLKSKPKAVLFIKDPVMGERFVQMTKIHQDTVTQALIDLGLSTDLKKILSVDDQVLLAISLHSPYITPKTRTIVHDYGVYPSQVRPPIVTIMGHVDHGKTSILDYIRQTHITRQEFGGITQKIGAYTAVYAEQYLTFLDTPGHKAFAAIRARGSAVADIVVLVIDVTSGIQPQTLEAISYIQDKRIPTIIALNKIDKEHPPLQHLYDALASQNMLTENYGGDIPAVSTSTVTTVGMDDLLQSILALAEMLSLRAAVDGPAEGYTLESRLDQRMGTRTTVVITNGQLHIGDILVAGESYGVVKALRDEFDRPLRQAGPSMPVDVMGLHATAELGTQFSVAPDLKTAKAAVDLCCQPETIAPASAPQIINLTQLLQAAEPVKALHVILKANAQGSLAALQQEIQTLVTETRQIKVKLTGIGSITPDDLEFAAVSQSVIIYFNALANVGDRNTVMTTVKGIPITVIQSNIVYRLMEEIDNIFTVQEKQNIKEVLGHAEVVAVFQGIEQKIAGCKVINGKLMVNTTVHIIRDGKVLLAGKIQSLRHMHDNIKEARAQTECGVIINGYKPLSGDKIEFYK
jgi:translation initiation factor IF-2